ncbi:MAG: hypothetical protein JNK70_14985, partial [Phycisphaerae bacterium]|nr:hypothetical protein [Phycisphaerae bacterium]
SKEDIVALSGLTQDEIDAIAEHEHLADCMAATLGQYLLHMEHGAEKIRDMIVDDLRAARAGGNHEHARCLLLSLRQFLHDYPEGRRTA